MKSFFLTLNYCKASWTIWHLQGPSREMLELWFFRTHVICTYYSLDIRRWTPGDLPLQSFKNQLATSKFLKYCLGSNNVSVFVLTAPEASIKIDTASAFPTYRSSLFCFVWKEMLSGVSDRKPDVLWDTSVKAYRSFHIKKLRHLLRARGIT